MTNRELQYESLLRDISTRCNGLCSEDLGLGLSDVLSLIGRCTEVDTCMVVLFSDNSTSLGVAHQWSDDKQGKSEWLQDLSREDFPWLLTKLKDETIVTVPDVQRVADASEPEQRIWQQHQIAALAAVALKYRGSQIGFFVITSRSSRADWDVKLEKFLLANGQILADLFGRTAAEQKTASKVTELEELVEQTEARYGSILESLAEGLIMADRDGFLTYCNNRFTELTAYPKNEVLGRRIYEVFYENSGRDISGEIEQMHKRYEARMRGVAEEYELEVTRKDGQVRWLEVRAAPLRDVTGAIVGSIGMNIDITERKQLEAQLRWSQKMEAVGRLAGGVAHDFNNLLTVISGYANMMLSRIKGDDPNHRRVQAIKDASEAACSLTQQLLTVSRRQVVQPKVLDLNEVISHTTSIIRGLTGDNIKLVTDLKDELPAIEVDPGQLQQIIMNLAVNARDAMPRGGELCIKTYDTKIEQSRDVQGTHELESGAYVVLSMSDTGDGMDEKTQSHLFEPFFTTKRGGTGLGLSTIYGIVKQHGGNITVESTQGKGTKFTVYLPRAKAGAVLERPVVVHSAGGNESILVVEDEEAVRELVRETLEQKGYHVLEAGHGGEALELVATTKETINLILTDIVMPQVNGFELYEKVMHARPDIKILMMSGCTHDSTIPENILKYDIPFLAKPFSPELLAHRIRELLDGDLAASPHAAAAGN